MSDDPAAETPQDLPALTQRLHAESQRLSNAIQERFQLEVSYGAVELSRLRGPIDADALVRLLIAKGLITPEEWQYSLATTLHDALAAALQQCEEVALKARAPKIALPDSPRASAPRRLRTVQ